MTTSTHSPAPRRSLLQRVWPFTRHFAEMVLAMLVGMTLLDPLWKLVCALFGWTPGADLQAMVMAAEMTLSMSLWMRYRGHGWRDVTEMGAAMVLPFAVLLLPYWAGLISGGDLHTGGHVLMLAAMLALMLARRAAYTTHHEARPRSIAGVISRRWPSWIALAITVDNWVNPWVPAPWLLLLLSGAYLVIGLLRRELHDRRLLVMQLAAFAAYVVLAGVAMAVDATLMPYLVAAGWLAHSGWDILHHRLGKVVPKAYAEGCAVFDAVVGLTILILI
ncbi:DUF6010 family protein [Nonomuraea sp. NPDC050328]|uniref:DUF6010 family protein n=1 Tax=Nonomuraea sp. NPDC050328 TaxID=3364361 RepID=UPI0037A87067